MKTTMSKDDMIMMFNTPDRVGRIENFTVELVRPTSEDFCFEFSDRIVSSVGVASTINDLLVVSVETFTKKLGEKIGSKLARKHISEIIERKMKDLLIHCEIYFEDEFSGDIDCDLEDNEFLLVSEQMITKVHYDYD